MQKVANIQEIETAIKKYGDIVVSKNNENNVIIMSIEEYKKLNEDIDVHLSKSEEDIEEGRVKNAKEVFKELKEKYGF